MILFVKVDAELYDARVNGKDGQTGASKYWASAV
jgi:hypothetical protein